MNELAAKQKWCPMSRPLGTMPVIGRHVHGNGSELGKVEFPLFPVVGANRDSGGAVVWTSKCIASECMMWRNNPVDAMDGYCDLAGFQNHAGHG